MQVSLHANATTTPRTRAYIQHSTAAVRDLANELGVSETTVRRWRARRGEVADRSHTPHTLQTRFEPLEEAVAVELRTRLRLSLDDALEVMRRCLKPDLSRSALHRCWARHGVAAPPATPPDPAQSFDAAAPAGFVHLDSKQLTALNGERAYAYVAIDRATRFVVLDIRPDRKGATGAAFLTHALTAFPFPVHTVLTDNGGEFTDRFAVDKPGKPEGQPSGMHPFDRVCTARGLRHKLARPFRPQTNGMVERFNRRLSDALATHPPCGSNQGKNRFHTQAERTAFLKTFVSNYNRTRLRCLGYKAPIEAAHNLPEHNTFAGMTRHYLKV